MKCAKCGKSWDLFKTEQEDYMICPFCKEKLVTKYENFNSAAEGISYCMKLRGKGVLKNKNILKSLIKDVFGNSFPADKMLYLCIENDIGAILLDADEKDGQEKIIAAHQAVQQLVQEFSIAQTKAEEMVSYFTDALEWENVFPKEETASSVSEKMQQKITGSNAAIHTNTVGAAHNGNASLNADAAKDAPGRNAEFQASADNMASNAGGDTSIQKAASVNNDMQAQTAFELHSDAENQKKKKSHKGCIIIFFIILLLIACFLIWFFLFNRDEMESENVSAPIETEESTEEEITEPEIEETEAEITVAETTEPESDMSDMIETEPVTDTPANASGYSVTKICSIDNINSISSDMGNLNFEPVQYDAINQRIYYLDGLCKLNYYDMNSGTITAVFDVTENAELSDGVKEYKVNPYNGNVYVIFNGSYSHRLYDVENDQWIELNLSSVTTAPLFFVSENEVVYGGKQYDLTTYQIVAEGVEPDFGTGDYCATPVLHNNEYYYFCRNWDSDYQPFFVKTVQLLSANDNAFYIQNEVYLKSPYDCAFFVDSDTVYYMTKDHSIYQVNIDTLYSADKTSSPLDNSSGDILIVDGSSIENNATSYLSEDILEFIRIDETHYIVLDGRDKSIKMISNFSAPQD